MVQHTLSLNDIHNNNDIIVKKFTFNNIEYSIIKYKKNNLKNNESDLQVYEKLTKFRSLIVRNNRVVCYSPPKSIPYDKFIEKYPDTNQSHIEDFIDGTMINVFFDNINNCWEIATKSTIGGNILFFNDIKNYNYFENVNNDYTNTTFRTLFFETCNVNNFDLNSLNKKYSYTFVMQHPFNRIVTPVASPSIYLVRIYDIDNTNFPSVCVNEIDISNYVNTPPYVFINTHVKFISKYNIDPDYNNTLTYYSSEETPYYLVGCMIYNNDGTRTKIRNVNYENVRKLRGNQPKLQYNYLSLKKQNKVEEFLKYYPEYIVLFNKFKIILYNYTNELFLNYINCFIQKEKPLKEYNFQYKTHMYYLHQKYINDLKPNNKFVDKKYVIDYVNSLEPAQQMFVINYKLNTEHKLNKENTESTETIETTETTETNEDISLEV